MTNEGRRWDEYDLPISLLYRPITDTDCLWARLIYRSTRHCSYRSRETRRETNRCGSKKYDTRHLNNVLKSSC